MVIFFSKKNLVTLPKPMVLWFAARWRHSGFGGPDPERDSGHGRQDDVTDRGPIQRRPADHLRPIIVQHRPSGPPISDRQLQPCPLREHRIAVDQRPQQFIEGEE